MWRRYDLARGADVSEQSGDIGLVVVRHPNGFTQVFGPFEDPLEVGQQIHKAIHDRYGSCNGVDTWVSELCEFDDASSLPPSSSQLDDPDLIENLAGIADTVREVGAALGMPMPSEIGWQTVEGLLDMRKRRREGAFEDSEDERVAVHQAHELRRYRKALGDLARLSEPNEEAQHHGHPLAFEIATRALRGEDIAWEHDDDDGGES